MCLRGRGRWPQKVPTDRHVRIIQLAEIFTYRQVGERMGLHKQAVHRIVKRWKERQQQSRASVDSV